MLAENQLLSRRTILKSSVALATVATFLSSTIARAAWPKLAYEQESLPAALNQLYGSADAAESEQISLKIPEIAENGAVVPVQVKTTLKDVKSISLFVDKNPNPLVARFKMGSTQQGVINTRIKMGHSSDVIAVVQSGNKLFKNKRFVKVTIGGCGG